MARRTQSYAWALLPEAADRPVDDLSERAQEGLAFAEALASDHRRGSAKNMNWREHHPLTVAELARERGLSESRLRRLIAQARRELFGQIGDSAIYKRLERDTDRDPDYDQPETCHQEGCEEELPLYAHGNRRYCDHHRSAAARARRHRTSQA
jgi:AraC-like DNA-binding protein